MRAAPAAQGPADRQWTWLVSAEVWLQNGWSPQWAPGLWLAVAYGSEDWRLRAGPGFASAGHVSVAGEQARFDWVGLAAAACLGALRGEWVSLAACAWAQPGATRGEGVRSATIVTTRSQWREWMALGPGVELSHWFGSAARLELAVGLLVPVVHPMFVYDTPHKTVHTTPNLTVWVSTGLAIGIL
jgi:hypothetical protein